MSDTIMIKSGSLGERASMPKLSEDELGYQKDEKALYIGDGKSNVRLCGSNDVSGMNDKIAGMTVKIADNDTKISKTETEMDKIKADIAELKRTLSDINSRLDALTSTNQ